MTEHKKTIEANYRQKEHEPRAFRPSIEIFPSPTVGERVAEFLDPSQVVVNITSSPTQGIDSTLDLARFLAKKGFDIVPHIGAQEVVDKNHLVQITNQLKSLGTQEIFVIKGDGIAKGKYTTAAHLLKDLKDTGLKPTRVGIGGYPEGLGEMGEDQMLKSIKTREKLVNDLGAELKIVTQICFDEEKIVEFAEKIKSEGINAQIIVGLPVSEKMKKLHEIAVRCRVGKSKDLLLESDPDSIYSPQNLVNNVIKRDEKKLIEGFHIYSFNKIQKLKSLLS